MERDSRRIGQELIPDGIPRVVVIAGIVAVFFLGLQRIEGIAGTQLTYFPQALRLAGETGLENDWFSNTTPTHLAFFGFAALFSYLGVLQVACDIGSMAVLGCGLAAIYLQGLWVHDIGRRRNWRFARLVGRHDFATLGLLASVTALLVRQLLLVTVFSGTLLNLKLGFAHQEVQFLLLFSNTSAPLIVYLGLALLPFGRYRAAGICFGIAAAFHASFVIHCTAVVTILMVWLAAQRRIGDIVKLVLPFALIMAPFAAYAAWLQSAGGDDLAYIVERLANERIAHHVFPSEWWRHGRWNWVLMIILLTSAVGLLALTEGPLRWIYAISVAYVAAGTAYVYATHDVGIGMLFPWRASSYLVPLGVFLMVLGAVALLLTALGVVRVISMAGRVTLVAASMFGVAIGLAVTLQTGPGYTAEDPTEVAFATAVRDVVSPDDLILIPSDWMNFRTLVLRPIFVDQKSHPFRKTELVEWFRRLEVNEAFFTLPSDRKVARCAELGADYFADRIAAGDELPGQPIVTSGDRQLYSCRDSG